MCLLETTTTKTLLSILWDLWRIWLKKNLLLCLVKWCMLPNQTCKYFMSNFYTNVFSISKDDKVGVEMCLYLRYFISLKSESDDVKIKRLNLLKSTICRKFLDRSTKKYWLFNGLYWIFIYINWMNLKFYDN